MPHTVITSNREGEGDWLGYTARIYEVIKA